MMPRLGGRGEGGKGGRGKEPRHAAGRGGLEVDTMIAKAAWIRAFGRRRQQGGVGALGASCDTLASYRRGFSFPFPHGRQVISPVNT